jgi:hypothetical protein
MDRARVLTRVTMFWLRRVRDLTPALTKLLGVQNVWCDTRTEQNSQNFVIWAGYVLEQRWVDGGMVTVVACALAIMLMRRGMGECRVMAGVTG